MNRTFMLLATLVVLLSGASRVEAELKVEGPLDVSPAGPTWVDPIWSVHDEGGTNVLASAVETYPLRTGGQGTLTSSSGAFLVDNLLSPSRVAVSDHWGSLFGAVPWRIDAESKGPRDDAVPAHSAGEGPFVASIAPPAIHFTPEPNTLAIAAVAGLGLLLLPSRGVSGKPGVVIANRERSSLTTLESPVCVFLPRRSTLAALV